MSDAGEAVRMRESGRRCADPIVIFTILVIILIISPLRDNLIKC